VRAAGRIPVQRDTLYNEVRRWNGGNSWNGAAA
jgi:2-iminoacetate synthase ThiH